MTKINALRRVITGMFLLPGAALAQEDAAQAAGEEVDAGMSLINRWLDIGKTWIQEDGPSFLI